MHTPDEIEAATRDVLTSFALHFGNTSKDSILRFEELFNLDDLQRIQDEFSAATGVASLIIRPDGTPITQPSNYASLCSEVVPGTNEGCANCSRSNARLANYEPSAPIITTCMGGRLWNSNIAITASGRHVANWLIGQVRRGTQSEADLRAYAKEIGADEDRFMAAFNDLPVMTRDRFEYVTRALFSLANELAAKAALNVRQNEAIAAFHALHEDLQAREAEFREFFDAAPIGYQQYDATGRLVRVNQTELDVLGYTSEEMVGHFVWEFVEGTERWRPIVLDKLAGKGIPTTSFERNYLKKDGSLVPVLIQDRVLRDKSGQIVGIRSALIDITARKEAEEKINRLAFYDSLTGLPNRTLLQDRLMQAMAASDRAGSYGAVLLIDLDHFKTLNDTLGHDMGDLLLRQVANRLNLSVRQEDTVARQGGDEFVVILVDLGKTINEAASSVRLISEKVCSALRQPYQLRNVLYECTPSIGATTFQGLQTKMETLVKQADLALYKAKDGGRNTVAFFDPALAHEVERRATLVTHLRDAVQHGQFELHYQAQVVGDRIQGAEALLRWRHPERGWVPPSEFVPAAEESGLILPLGRWVVESACTQLAAWATVPQLAPLTLSINISARQLNDPNFIDHVMRALESTGAPAEHLQFELTESVMIENVEETIAKMSLLKEKGVGFSLDDFGTGYSSLAYLKRLPLDQLKIDRSFVRDILIDPSDAAIARTIVVLAASLGLVAVAEGVETEAQRDALRQQGCEAYQGYFVSRPVPCSAFEAFVSRLVN